MKRLTSFAAAFALLLTVSLTALAQPAPGSAGISASFTKILGVHNAFTADMNMDITTPDGKTMNLPAKFAVLDTKMRSEIDMTQVKGQALPPAALEGMRQMGMDRVVNLTRADLKTTYIIYPGLKAYAKMALSKQDAATLDQDLKIETTALGKETVAGHPCVKNKVVMTTADKQTQEFTVWNATDLKDFPVQVKTSTKEGSLLMRYDNIKMAKPEAALFEPPTGYTAYADIQQMMMAEMQKLMGGFGAPK